MTREEFWQRMYMQAFDWTHGKDSASAFADDALAEYDARFPNPTFQYHADFAPPAGIPHPLGHE